MKYVHLTSNVVDFEMTGNPRNVFGSPFVDEFVFTEDSNVTIGWLFNGTTFTAPVILPKTSEEIKQEITNTTSLRLDSFAKTRNYDSILSACTYATSSVPQFAQEGQYCVTMRDATWGKLYQIMQEVEAGTRPMLTGYADIEAELPVLDWANV